MDYLNRHNAPFEEETWRRIDQAAVKAASDLLTGRRILDVDGPYGVGLTSIEAGQDDYIPSSQGSRVAQAVMGHAIAVPMLRAECRLSIRRLAAYYDMHLPLDLTPVEDAAEAVAMREEELIYYGQPELHLQGLMTAEGRNHHDGGDWNDIDQALNDVLAAVNALDHQGFRGPYALALSPALYNGLFRRYAGTSMLQLEHLRRLCQRGVYKASITGGVLVDARAGKCILGQDLMAGYIGQDGVYYQLYLSESIVFRLDEARAICTIKTF